MSTTLEQSSFHDDKGSAGFHNEHVHRGDELLQQVAPISKRLVIAMLWTSVASFGYGFGASIIASSLGQPNLYVDLNLVGRTNLTQIIGCIASFLNIGGLFGLVMTAWLQDRFGRKPANLVCSVFYIVGTVICVASQNVQMFIASRFIIGIGAWGFVLSSIVYQSELSPATRRGVLAGSVGVSLSLGYVTAAWTGVGFYFVTNQNNWRIPIAISLLFPLTVLAGYPFVPESPRWLISKDRDAEAFKILVNLHGEAVAKEEEYQIKQQTALDRTLPSSYASLFTKYGKRTVAAVLVITFYQGTGIQVIANYGPVIYGSLGFSPLISLILGGATGLWSFLINFLAAAITDRTGRKIMITGSIVGSGICLAIFCALLATNPDSSNVAIGRATIAMVFIYLIPYSFCEPIAFLYLGECYPTHVRTKGVALGLIAVQFMSIWITLAQPTAVAAIGWKFYMIFVVMSVVGGTFLWFAVPETKNVPLEEIAKLFGDEDVAVFSGDIVVDDKTGEVRAVQHGHHA